MSLVVSVVPAEDVLPFPPDMTLCDKTKSEKPTGSVIRLFENVWSERFAWRTLFSPPAVVRNLRSRPNFRENSLHRRKNISKVRSIRKEDFVMEKVLFDFSQESEN